MKHLDLDFNLFCRSITVKDMSHNFFFFCCFQYTIFLFSHPHIFIYSLHLLIACVARRRKEQMMSLHEGDKSVMFFLPKLYTVWRILWQRGPFYVWNFFFSSQTFFSFPFFVLAVSCYIQFWVRCWILVNN